MLYNIGRHETSLDDAKSWLIEGLINEVVLYLGICVSWYLVSYFGTYYQQKWSLGSNVSQIDLEAKKYLLFIKNIYSFRCLSFTIRHQEIQVLYTKELLHPYSEGTGSRWQISPSWKFRFFVQLKGIACFLDSTFQFYMILLWIKFPMIFGSQTFLQNHMIK